MIRNILKFTALLLVATVVLSSCNGAITGNSVEKAPDFRLLGTDGKTVTLADFKGKPIFINFWETT